MIFVGRGSLSKVWRFYFYKKLLLLLIMVAGKTKRMEKSIVAPIPTGAVDQATVFPSLEEFDNAARSNEISK